MKKGYINRFFGVFLTTLIVLATVFGGFYVVDKFFNWKPLEFSVTGGSGGGVVGGTYRGYATETITFVATDSLNTSEGVEYVGGYVYPLQDGEVQPTVTVSANATGGSSSYAADSHITGFLTPTDGYTVAIDTYADKTKTIRFPVVRYATPQVYVYNVSKAGYVGTWNSTNSNLSMVALGLTAGGSSETFDIYLQVNNAYRQFGSKGIIVGCTGWTTTKYTIGSDMTEIDVGDYPKLTNDNVKRAWRSTVTSVKASEGRKKIGSLTIALNGGQTGSEGLCYIYDVANARSSDQKNWLYNAISSDDASTTDLFATNPVITFPV